MAEALCARQIDCMASVATEYGREVMRQQEHLVIREGRMGEPEMEELMRTGTFLAVVDATHPYAVEVTEHIKESAKKTNLPYLRLSRSTAAEREIAEHEWMIHTVADTQECVELLSKLPGNILLTTGSKELHAYAAREEIRERLFVRVLPGVESIEICHREQIPGKQIIAMQGPFGTELNEALIRQYDIGVLVTKESGQAGGFPEKIRAAEHRKIPVVMIQNPEQAGGMSMEKVLSEIETLCGKKSGTKRQPLQISLVGIGMGNTKLFTGEAREAIGQAKAVCGAKRLLAAADTLIAPDAEKREAYLPADLLPYIYSCRERKIGRIAILFSGDTGFYSGAEAVYKALQEEVRLGKLQAGITICPGISSLSYLAARAGKSWQDAKIVSTHGREADVTAYVRSEENVFLIVSGRSDLIRIGEELEAAGLSGVELTIGYQLSYKEERIWHGTPEVCRTLKDDGLYACLIENPGAQGETLAPGVPDRWFVRGRVPMTKEEIRWLSLCRLGLKSQSVFYDIGSGTGSIAVEAALRSKQLRVYAVEHGEEACGLIAENASRAGVKNLVVVKGEAPECLGELPVPTHAFIGGSGGRLREILLALREKNPNVRVVLNAVSLETVAEVVALWKELLICEEEITQIAVSRAKKAGSHHLMQAENPIYVISFSLSENGEGEEQKPDRREER